MEYEHKELIHDYLNLNRHIKRIERRIEQEELEFNTQTFCGITDLRSPLVIKQRSFKVDERVCSYVDLINTYKQNIQINERKARYFNQFINELDPHTVVSLKRRYSHARHFEDAQELGHDYIVLDEILEIEEAISFEFNIGQSNELQRKVIQVEYTRFSKDTVEDSFQTMQSLLGV